MLKKHLLLLVSLGVLCLAANSIGGTQASFIDREASTGNTFTAWTSELWTQTTQQNFAAGVLNNVDTSSSSGNVKLALVPNPTIITQGNGEVSTDKGALGWILMKSLSFTKDGPTYDEIRVDSNLKATNPAAASISIRVDGIEKAQHETTSTTYVTYSDVIDLSTYADGMHTVELYLKSSNKNREAYNSVFEIYRTKTYASSGTIASPVFDSGIPGAKLDALIWDETLPAGADITFEVRASDTPFDKSASSPAWVSAGGTSPVTPGLPSGRYLQWRATLKPDAAGAHTPVLQEVRLYYH